MDQKGHIMDQKGLQIFGKMAKNRVFGLKIPVFCGIFLNGFGGYPVPLPLDGKSL